MGFLCQRELLHPPLLSMGFGEVNLMKQGKKRIHIYKVLPNKDVCLCHLGIDLTPKIGVKLRAGGVGQRLRVPAQLIRLCLDSLQPH